MGWESETQDAQHLKTAKSLDKELDGSFIYLCHGKAQEHNSCMAGDTLFVQVCAVDPLISVLMNSLISNWKKGINVMLVEQSWEEISPLERGWSSKEQSLS